MKGYSRFGLLAAALTCVVSISSSTWQTASAQATTPGISPQATPAQSKPAGPPVPSQHKSTSSAPASAQISTPRERREQAYAKILEGQAYLSSIQRNVNSAANVRLAQQAFQQAAALDPTLAEAHTALGEIAFFFPPQDFDLAAREAALATAINPNNFGAHRILARVFSIKSGLRDNNLNKTYVERAIAELREVTRLDPANAEAWALLGELYKATGRNAEAVDAWTRWAAAPPASDPRIYQFITRGRDLSPAAAAARLGEALIAAGRTTEAIAAIRRAMSLNPENKEYGELLGQALEVGGGDDNSVIAELQRMVAADPANTTTLRLLALRQARAGQVDRAVATLREAIARQEKGDQEQEALRETLAQIFSDASRYADAIAVYEELLKDRGIGDAPLASEEQKEFAAAILQRIVNTQKLAGHAGEATATFDRMRRLLGKDDPRVEAQYIEFLRAQGKRQEALEATRAARSRFPELGEFVFLEAGALADLGRVDEGVALLRARLRGALQDFRLHLFIASLYSQAGRGREAVSAATKALELVPANRQDLMTDALIVLSSAQERAGDPKGSENSLRRVLAMEPNNATALNNLGYFLVERNERLNEALEMIQRAVRAEPNNSSFLDSLGWAHFKLGQLNEAERHLSEAARRNSSSATIQEHLGDLYQRQGKSDQARAAWQKALSLSVEADEIARIKSKLSGETKK